MDALKPHGLTLPVDFAAKGSATLGGNVSTNVGGVRVLAYGPLRGYVLGLKVVLADGTVVDSIRGLYKNNAGFDLKQLFIASEGTLGIVTEVLLKAVSIPGERVTFLLAAPDLSGLLHFLKDLRLERVQLAAVEFFNHACLEKVMAHLRVASPFAKEAPFYALIEAESFSTERDAELTERFVGASESGLIGEVLLAQSPRQKREFWRYREEITESLSPFKPHKNDLSVPLAHLSAFTDELTRELAAHSPFTICLFGHLADGNVHVNLLKPEDMNNAEFIAKALALDEVIYDIVFKHEGSVSAEHGIGLGKKFGNDRTFRPEELALLKKIKRTLDPKNILNPGKIFD
jgi:FAD/FMN-containing dehydrogenase